MGTPEDIANFVAFLVVIKVITLPALPFTSMVVFINKKHWNYKTFIIK